MPRQEPDPLNPNAPGHAPLYSYTEPPKPFRAPLDGAESFDAIVDHIERHIGPAPMCYHEIVSDKVHLDVIPVLPTDSQPYHTFVTSGMSDEPMTAVPDAAAEYQYAELLIRLPKSWPVPVNNDMSPWNRPEHFWPIRLLKNLARFPHEFHTWVGTGHTVEVGSLDGAGEFVGAIILPPLSIPPPFSQLRLTDSKKIHFYVIIPLYREEMDFKRANGLEALLDRFPDPEIAEVVDPARPNYVTGIELE